MARRSVDDELANDVLVDIPRAHGRRFGCSGKLLNPSRGSVEALVRKVPRGRVLTTALLREMLAKRHKAQVTCPFLTKRALMAIADDPKAGAPFWRVVIASGEMISAYPAGGAAQARHLRDEGVTVATRSGKSRVAELDARLVRF
jgi:alkylated DNA nucleotide flippase Atl1